MNENMNMMLDTALVKKSVQIADTIRVVSKDEITELYKTLLQAEQDNHSLFLTVLFALIGLLLGFTWWWNKSGAEKYIEVEVEKRVALQLAVEKAKLEKSLVETISAEINSNMEVYLLKIKRNELNILRSTAYILQVEEKFAFAVSYWAEAILIAIEINNGKFIRSITIEIIRELDILREKKENKLYKLKALEKLTLVMPDTLIMERNKIRENIKGLTAIITEDEEL